MEPVSLTLGVIVAGLVAKATDRAEDTVVDVGATAVSRIVEWLRARLPGGKSSALERLQDAPDSPAREKALADEITVRAEASPDFAAELQGLVEQARVAGIEISPAAQTVTNSEHVVQNAHIRDSTITTTFGAPSVQRPL